MNFLLSLVNASDKAAITETNANRLDASLAFMLQPSVDGTGSPTIVLGPPTAGAHVLDELWVDALGAVFCCRTAGTPGTWVQIQPAVLLAADVPPTPPDKYLVFVIDGPWTLKYYNAGGAAYVVKF
jgi:hypothetical protein